MIDLRAELLSFHEVARRLRRDGRSLHISTIHRWRSRGVCGVRLEATRLGREWVTTADAVARFLEAISGSECAIHKPDRRARAEAALQRLRARGVRVPDNIGSGIPEPVEAQRNAGPHVRELQAAGYTR